MMMRRRSIRALMAAAAAALLLSLAAAYMSIIWIWYGEEEEETRRMFVEWMAEYNRTYNDIGEEERRYAVFKDNRRYVDQFNAVPNRGYRIGLNRFADLTNEELSAWWPGAQPQQPGEAEEVERQFQAADNQDHLPDWRKNKLGAVAKGLFLLLPIGFGLGLCCRSRIRTL